MSTNGDRFEQWLLQFGQKLDKLFAIVELQAKETDDLRELLASLSKSVTVTATSVGQIALQVDKISDIVAAHERRLRRIKDQGER